MAHAFISYAHEDADYVRRLVQALERRGIAAWIDDQIPKGALWAQSVIENLTGSAALVVIMTPAAEGSEWVQKELLIALDRRLPVFPLLLEGKPFPLIIDRQYEDVGGGALPSQAFSARLKEVVGGRNAPVGEEAAPSTAAGATLVEEDWLANAYVDALEGHFEEVIREMPAQFTAQRFILKLAQRNQTEYIRALSAYEDSAAPFRALHVQLSKRLKERTDLAAAIGSTSARNLWNETSESELYRKLLRRARRG
ncbi:MAG: toll/interleukin-1 receptor domain-containing protein [Anaerolineae bacterium]|nr:toll/interleukin-1 receptor domain-containing protein [Anaerolineae bacterium]NUQ05596.1 toll/interleukin-1 receptor domain-containing protein [Anaerolineae bacterium]